MFRRTCLIVTRLLLVITAFSWGVAQNSAPARKATRTQEGKQTIITDAAGRVHVRSPRVTYAERRAAAKARVKAMREAAAKKKLGEVKK
jgi:hypothetical protein